MSQSTLIEHVSEFGLNRANPHARKDNNLKIVSPDDPGTAGQDTLTKAAATALFIKTVTFAGEVYVADPMIPANDPDAVNDFLLNIVKIWEVDAFLKITFDSGTLTVVHIGAQSITEIKFDDDSTITPTRVDTIKTVCDNKYMFVGDPGVFTDGTGTPAALANVPYNYSGVPATDMATAAQLKTDIEAYLTAESTDYESVTVYPNNIEGQFQVVINAEKGVNSFSFNADAFTVSGCADIFG